MSNRDTQLVLDEVEETFDKTNARFDQIEQRQRLQQAALDSLLRGQEEILKLLKVIASTAAKAKQPLAASAAVGAAPSEKPKREDAPAVIERPKRESARVKPNREAPPATEAAQATSVKQKPALPAAPDVEVKPAETASSSKPKRRQERKIESSGADAEALPAESIPRPTHRRTGMINAMIPTQTAVSPVKKRAEPSAKDKDATKSAEPADAERKKRNKKQKSAEPKCAECRSTENLFATRDSVLYCAECWATFGSCDVCTSVSLPRAQVAVAHFTGAKHAKHTAEQQNGEAKKEEV